jgi:hypothetical protein
MGILSGLLSAQETWTRAPQVCERMRGQVEALTGPRAAAPLGNRFVDHQDAPD